MVFADTLVLFTVEDTTPAARYVQRIVVPVLSLQHTSAVLPPPATTGSNLFSPLLVSWVGVATAPVAGLTVVKNSCEVTEPSAQATTKLVPSYATDGALLRDKVAITSAGASTTVPFASNRAPRIT